MKENLIELLKSQSIVDRETAIQINKSLHLIDDMLAAFRCFVKDAEAHIIRNGFSLDLNDNQLTALPAEIGNLTALQSLYLQYNPLSKKELSRIKELLPNCKIYF